MNKSKAQSGVSLYLTIIVMIVLLAIVLGLTVILIDQIKMVQEIGFSVIALSAADAGIEAILVNQASPTSTQAYIDCGLFPDTFCSLGNGAEYYLEVLESDSPGCPASVLNFCITSVGIYEGVRRAIEITY